jgi:hypothetical protein
VHRVEIIKYLEVFEGFRKECVQESFEDSSLQRKLRRSSALNTSKGDRSEVTLQRSSQVPREGTFLFRRNLSRRERAVEILCGESPKQRGL